MVMEEASAHEIPVVLHDFPLPMHNWAFEGAVWARYFDKTSASLGNEFRKARLDWDPRWTGAYHGCRSFESFDPLLPVIRRY